MPNLMCCHSGKGRAVCGLTWPLSIYPLCDLGHDLLLWASILPSILPSPEAFLVCYSC